MRCDTALETDAEAECTDRIHEQFATVSALLSPHLGHFQFRPLFIDQQAV